MEPSRKSDEMRALQLHHAQQVCGIVAHTDNKGILTVAIRSLALVSPVLTDEHEREEVISLLAVIQARRGWYLGNMEAELQASWRLSDSQNTQTRADESRARVWTQQGISFAASSVGTKLHGEPATLNMTASILPRVDGECRHFNPLGSADFNLPNRPYQNWYEKPNDGGEWDLPLF